MNKNLFILGIVVIIALGLVVFYTGDFGASRTSDKAESVSEETDGGATASDAPEQKQASDLFAIFPNLPMTDEEQAGLQVSSTQPVTGSEVLQAFYRSNRSVAELGEVYVSYIASQGFSVTDSDTDQDNIRFYLATRGEEEMTVSIQSLDDFQLVNISYQESPGEPPVLEEDEQ